MDTTGKSPASFLAGNISATRPPGISDSCCWIIVATTGCSTAALTPSSPAAARAPSPPSLDCCWIILATTGYVVSTASQSAAELVTQPDAATAGIIVSFSAAPAILIGLSLITLVRYRLRRSDIDAGTGPEAVARSAT